MELKSKNIIALCIAFFVLTACGLIRDKREFSCIPNGIYRVLSYDSDSSIYYFDDQSEIHLDFIVKKKNQYSFSWYPKKRDSTNYFGGLNLSCKSDTSFIIASYDAYKTLGYIYQEFKGTIIENIIARSLNAEISITKIESNNYLFEFEPVNIDNVKHSITVIRTGR